MVRSLRPIAVFGITTRTLQVRRVADVTGGMRRVTLAGPQLAAHTAANGYPVAAFRSDGFDDEFKLILPHPDAVTTVGPTQADGVLNWPRQHPHLLVRTYTVRRWDPDAGELDVDFVKHGVGPATSWAYRVQPGEPVQIAGPKSSSPHPQGVDWTLVAGDETALPAIARWLENWPAAARGQLFIEVAEPGHRQELAVPEGVEITWLSRDGAEPGTTTLLFDAIKAAPWWDGTAFAWVAGETLTIAPIRRWLRHDKAMSKEQVEVTGYWRRREVVRSHTDPTVQDLDATEDTGRAFAELTEIVPGFALRVAATIGLAAAFDSGERTLTELAKVTASDPTGLAKLLRYLCAAGITEDAGDGRYRLSRMGRELENDRIVQGLSLEDEHAQQELGGMLALLAAIRTGEGNHESWYGSRYTARVLNDPALLASRAESEAENAVFVAGALSEAPQWTDISTVTVVGRAAASFATALVKTHRELHATVIAAPSEIAQYKTLHGQHERVTYLPGDTWSTGEPADAALVTGTLHTLPDVDAAHVLAQAAAGVTAAGRVLVFGNVLDPDLAHEHDYEHDLIDFALHGGGARTHDEYLALFSAAGLAAPQRSTIGWGRTLYTATVSGR